MTDKIIKASEESDRKLIEFEEKRMKFEQKEKECDKRIRKEEGEFQLRLFSMMYSSSQQGYPQFPPSWTI